MARASWLGRRTVAGASVAFAILAVCAPAGAAQLEVGYYDSPIFGGWRVLYSAGAETNHVTVAGDGHIYVFRDPGVPIAAPAFAPPHLNTDLSKWNPALGEDSSLYASHNCVAPKSKGLAMCVATPGDECNISGCYFQADVNFDTLAFSLGAGNDQLRLSRTTGRAVVDAGPGDDILDLRNGDRDIVACGDGFDRVRADAYEFDLRNCESVTHA